MTIAAGRSSLCRPRLQETVMGKYLIGWVLGVPVIVLVVAYFFFH